jgi:hypothetical protein
MIDVDKTIISQYAHSPVLLEMIHRLNDCICPREQLQTFYHMIWNVETAKGYGLDVWGRIVGISRDFKVTPKNKHLGFADGFLNFDNGIWSVGDGTTDVYTLADDAYRKLIMIKAMKNIMYATAYNINRLLISLFSGRGRAYFLKIGTMKARYVFEFNLTPTERAIIFQSDILPRPSGVLVDFFEPKAGQYFGFKEANLTPFDSGVFYLE